uniref:Nuclear respiratory factor 1 NLS/DNA-binding dimerisation domain-containing protein n=1 Tax=Biomphalaria glabrata TaxID=6526 RepID=A0A2C9L1K4_BIOGL
MEPDTMDQGKDLPPIALGSTTIPYLVTLIPVLVTMTTQVDMPSYSDEADKPAWWPDDVQWRNPKYYMNEPIKDSLQVLRKLVHSCYSYHGLEDLLNRFDETPVSETESEQRDGSDVILITDDADEGSVESLAESDGPVFVCCFCLEQFASHEAVQTHQSICPSRFQDLDSSPGYPASSKAEIPDKHHTTASASNKSVPQDSPTAVKVSHISKLDDTFLSQHKSHGHDQVSSSISSLPTKKPAHGSSSFKFVPTLKTRSQKKLDQIMEKHNQRQLMMKECQAMKPVPSTGAWWKKKRKIKCSAIHPGCYLSSDAFMSALNLVKKSELESRISDAPKDVDMDCQIISVEGPLSAVPITTFEKPSSTSPRSTRSLMSQLSRDNDVSSRRRLSFCFVEDEWADKEALEEGRDPLQFSLLTLDLSSPLGQRIRKYVKGEGHLNIIKDAESYCRTEVDDDSYSKLRYRGMDFRITFKKKKRGSTFVHKYKFNSSDKFEFNLLLKTGLSARSRHLKQCLPTCKVLLTRLKESEIKEWTEEKKITIAENIVFDDDICITQIDIPQSKLPQGFSSDKLTLQPQCSNFSSQFLQNSPNKHKLATNRPNLAHNLPPSPPHVPNIFRSRSHCSPSPTRPGPKCFHDRNRIAKSLNFSNVNTASPKNTTAVIKNGGERFMPHLSKHPMQSPSVYASRNSLPVIQNKLPGPSSRRKQPMNYVRREGFDGGMAQRNGDQNVGYIRDINNTCVVSKSAGDQDPTQNFRRLSNFDYFSIRNGKLHHPDQSAASPPATQKTFQLDDGGDNRNLHKSLPAHRPLPANAVAPLRTQQKTFSRTADNGPKIKPQISSSSRPHSVARPEGKRQPVNNSLMEHLADTVSVPDSTPRIKSFMSLCPTLDGEDEIMEIICVDDD